MQGVTRVRSPAPKIERRLCSMSSGWFGEESSVGVARPQKGSATIQSPGSWMPLLQKHFRANHPNLSKEKRGLAVTHFLSKNLPLLCTACLVACSATSTSSPPAAVPVDEPAPSDPVEAEPPPAAVAEEQPKKSEFEMPSVDFSEREDGVSGWMKAAGIQDSSPKALSDLAGFAPPSELVCDSLVPVGKPFEKAALCSRQLQHGLWELETFFLLVTPENGKLRVLWQTSSAASLIDRNDNSEKPFVQLDVSLQDDGQALFVQETEDYPCENVRVRLNAARAEADSEEKAALANIDRMASSLCRARGRYAWRNNTFVRVGPMR